jgi:hypothetical protein
MINPMSMQSKSCPHCAASDYNRISRSFFFKYFLFFIPVRRYFCNRCLNDWYVLDLKRSKVDNELDPNTGASVH